MKRAFTAVALCAAAALTAQVSFANDHDHQHSSSSSLSGTDSSSLSSSQDKSFKSQKLTKSEIRASKLMGINVASKDGENLGQVQDLIINPQTGKIRFALVGKGFMAGAGETLFPVPWQAVKVQSEKHFVLNVDEKKMESAPMWSQTQIDQPDYVLRIYRFFDLPSDMDNSQMGTSGQSIQGQGTGSSDLNQLQSPSDLNQSQNKSQSDYQFREPRAQDNLQQKSLKDNQQNDKTGIAPQSGSDKTAPER